MYLGDPAIAVLRAIPRMESDPWVLPGAKRGTHIAYLHDSWTRILERAGIENLRIHDLRHSFASGGLLVGEGLPMIGKLLGQTETLADMGRLCVLKQSVMGFSKISVRAATA